MAQALHALQAVDESSRIVGTEDHRRQVGVLQAHGVLVDTRRDRRLGLFDNRILTLGQRAVVLTIPATLGSDTQVGIARLTVVGSGRKADADDGAPDRVAEVLVASTIQQLHTLVPEVASCQEDYLWWCFSHRSIASLSKR